MKRNSLILTVTLVLLIMVTGVVLAEEVPGYDFGPPIFGLEAAPDGSLLVANASAGIVELRKGASSLAVELPGVTDLAPFGRGSMLAVTAGGEDPTDDTIQTLYSVSRGKAKAIADLGEIFRMEESRRESGEDGHSKGNPFE